MTPPNPSSYVRPSQENKQSEQTRSSITTTELFPNNFDLLRLFAALQVLLVHSIHHLQVTSDFFASLRTVLSYFPGVPVFFVISGFLISQSYSKSESLLKYVKNRICRIYPALLVCLVVSIISVLLISPWTLKSASPGEFIKWIFAQVTIVQFYNPSFLRDYGVGVLNGSLWTIPVELQFYAILPAIMLLIGFFRLRFPVLFTITIASLVLDLACDYYLTEGAQKYVDVTILPHLWMFCIGIIVQQHWTQINSLFVGKLYYWLDAYISICFLLPHQTPSFDFLEIFRKFILSGLVLAFAFSLRSLSENSLRGTDISYGLYIYHMLVVNALIEVGCDRLIL